MTSRHWRKSFLRPAPSSSVAVLALCGALNVAQAAGPLPVPCGGGTCGANLPFTPSTNPAAGLPTTLGNTMTVNQVDQRQIFNWKSFDIDPGYTVHFDQADASYAALNRIWSSDPSRIYGAITAKGQIFLINQNGIIFGNGAQVNVGSLVASSLDIQDQDFLNPIFFSSNQGGSSAFTMASGADSGFVRVDQGATLTTQQGGSIWLFAPKVTNSGTIRTEEGQVILAAGQKVYLQASDDPALRGFLVEVDNGGAAQNLGDILATRGNATLVGIAVNQNGRITATTSATLNGSIKLLARDTKVTGTDNHITAGNTSAKGRLDGSGVPLSDGVVLGPNSETSVTPELGTGQTSADAQTFIRSSIGVYGRSIQVLDNAQVIAPSGKVTFTAAHDPSNEQFSNSTATRASDVHVYFAPGSVVDVSGTRNVQLAMESNSIQVDLQGAQLADAPLQHNGFLKGAKVWVDVRQIANGKIPLADLSGYLGQIQRTVDERTTTGGTVKIQSEGDIVTRAGSRIDVSGGSVVYNAGFVKSTQLVSQGQVFDITTAPADRIYTGIADTYTVTDPKWGVTRTWAALGGQYGKYEPGYVEGKDAGSLTFQAFAYALDGQQVGNVVTGQRQRDNNQLPMLATLQIGSSTGRAFTPDVNFATQPTPLPAAYQSGDPLPNALTLSADALRQSGFGQVLVYSGGRIHVPSGVNLTLPEGGAANLVGLQVAVDGSITAHGGTVNLTSKQVVDAQAGQTALTIGPNAQIDVSGLWVNDLPQIAGAAPMTPLAINGGKVGLSSQSALNLEQGSVIDVSGGGRLDAGGKLKAGDAGGITLKANQLVNASDPSGNFNLGATLLGGALGQGGSVSISTLAVNIGGAPNAVPGGINLDPGFFNRGGFQTWNINGEQQLTVADGAIIAPTADHRVVAPGFALLPTGARLDQFSRRLAVPVELRTPVNITLSALNNTAAIAQGDLTIGTDASVLTDPGSAIKLAATQLLDVNGILSAPAGSITLTQAENATRGTSVNFDDHAGIWLGSHAQLLAHGATRILPDRYGVRSGNVLAGGSVNLAAYNGYVMADPNSSIDVSGVSGQMDKLPGTNVVLAQPATIGGDAGSVMVYASEGLVLGSALHGGVAVAGAASGQLSVTVERGPTYDPSNPNFNQYPAGDRTLVVTNAADMPTASDPGQGAGIAGSENGLAYVAADRLRASGFGSITLSGEDRIRFAGNADLTGFARSLTLDTPVIEANGAYNVNLAAPYVTLANTRYWRQTAGAPAGGGAHLNVTAAQNLDLVGHMNLSGFAASSFHSGGDIRLIGVAADPNDSTRKGQVASVGDLQFTARQIYPTTLTDFTLLVQDNPQGTIRFGRAQDAAGNPLSDTPVLSAGGTLTIEAPTIAQDGVIKAPLGHIVLDAADYESGGGDLTRTTEGTLSLGAGSITSVSLEGQVVPFGYVENGQLWKYGFADAVNLVLATPPDKRVELKGADVRVAPGAHLNLNGGGDLYASEFVPGPLGSQDALAGANLFAVIPALGNNVAPVDFQYGNGTTLKPGDSVYLSGGAGLAAGYYTLLPAHYALLPGAYAVRLANDGQPAIPGQSVQAIDGSAISAGYRYVAGTGIQNPGWSRWTIMPQAVVRNLAEYHDYSANTFFGQTTADQPVAPPLPRDAGQLILAATSTLTLPPGSVSMIAGPNGRGGLLDVDAPKIAVVDATGQQAGYLELTADSLSNLGAASILLGGRRSATADGMSVEVGATDVIVANDAQTPLTAPELMLAAKDRVTVEDGSVIRASGGGAGEAPVLHVAGPGALLRVSSTAHSRVDRGASGTGIGLLTVGAKTKLSGASLLFDATGNTAIAADAHMDARAISLAASRIVVGSADNADGLLLTSNLLQQVAGASELTLRSYSSIDLYDGAGFDLTTEDDGQAHDDGQLHLVPRKDAQGDLLISSLTLDAGAIVSHLTAGTNAQFTAHNIALTNSGGDVSASSTDAGRLTLTAKRIDANTGQISLSGGNQHIAGFADATSDKGEQLAAVTLDAGTQVIVQGKGTLTSDNGTLNIKAPRITAQDKADYTINSNGAVTLSKPADAISLPETSSLGAKLAINGASISHLGNIVLRGGEVALRATQGDVALGDATGASSTTDVSGWVEAFADQTRYYPGGKVTLQSDQGKVVVNSKATVDVSGGVKDSDGKPVAVGEAGQLQISAPMKTAQIDGTIVGVGEDGKGGSFELDAGSIAGAEALAQKLYDGGFTKSIQWRARTGDITLAQHYTGADGKQTEAKLQAANIGLEADGGSIDVAAKLNAKSARGGQITLAAKQDITLQSTATLDVSATDASARGGTIELLSSDGTIALKSGSTLVAAGTNGDGDVHLRAKRNTANTDFQIADLSAEFKRVNQVLLEAYKTYLSGGTISDSDPTITTAVGDAKDFMAHTDSIKTRLGITGKPLFQLAPGIEIQSASDLTLSADWSLANLRYDASNGTPVGELTDGSKLTDGQNTNGNYAAGVLTLRAAGNLNLNGSLSDGFSSAATTGTLQGIESWSYRLVAGADTSRADPNAVQSGTGDVVLAENKLVRTGTGFIDVAAGNDIKLASEGSVIYTAGHAAPPVPGWPTLGALKNLKFPIDGGDIRIYAGNDIVAAPESQLFTPWLNRLTWSLTNGKLNATTRPGWLPNFALFKQGVGALGGGNVTITAGRDINDLGAVIPTIARLAGSVGTLPDPANLLIQGGGNLTVTAGRDINSGLFYVARGTGTVRAGGNLGQAADRTVSTILGLGDGSFDVMAKGDLTLETVLNPTLLPDQTNGNAPRFVTYGADSGVRLTAETGNITLSDHASSKITTAFTSLPSPLPSAEGTLFQFYPGRLETTAFRGNFQNDGPVVLMPSATGNLVLLADGSVSFQGNSRSAHPMQLSGADPNLLPTWLTPVTGISVDLAYNVLSPPAAGINASYLPGTPLHQADDSELAYVVARNGDIVGDGTNLSVILSKPAWIEAGRDVKNAQFQLENHDVSTVSTVRAGRDIVYTDIPDPSTGLVSSSPQSLAISGPGRLEVMAGRNIDLGGSEGIVSRGNLDVANLPATGADLYVMAGLGQTTDGRVRQPDYQAFANAYFGNSPAGQQALADFFADVERQLRLNQTLTEADVQQRITDYRNGFASRALSEQALLVFFSELRQGGVQGSAGNYQRAYDAIAALFPARDYQGNIDLFNSQIKTEAGGNINLLAPGGLVNVGLAKPGNTKAASDQGIFTVSGGAIRSYSLGDFLVNQSRVFTLQGDDVLLWSTDGNIDAGKGSKTASASPPPRLVYRSTGFVLDTSSLVSGSGIGQLLARSGYAAGIVSLLAPHGDVNAGEAGIRVEGDLLVAAQRVIGANNIQVGGISVGVPVSQNTSLAGLSGTSSLGNNQASQDAVKSLQGQEDQQDQMKRIAQAVAGFQPSFISVDVVGFGPSGSSEEDERKRRN
jgi:filamentous hemagglutinin